MLLQKDIGRHFAFSLLQLLLAILIVALMIGLLLTAVQKVRDTSNRARSSNNLRQLALASLHFTVANGDLFPNIDGVGTSKSESVYSSLLPFLDANKSSAGSDGIAVFHSPADPTFLKSKNANCSYGINPLVYRKGAKMDSSISDGTSNTIGVAEHYAKCGKASFSWSLIESQCFDGKTNKRIPCYPTATHRATFADKDYSDAVPIRRNSASGIETVGSISDKTFQVAPSERECDSRLAQTPHQTGMLAAYIDGSVHTLNPKVAVTIYWGRVTPSGGERDTVD